MKKPMSEKSQEVKDAIETMFPGTARAIDNKICPLCRNPINFDIMTPFDLREYEISGMCKDCQDSIFKDPDT